MKKLVPTFNPSTVTRAIKAVQKAGIDIRTIRIEPDGAVVINGERGAPPDDELLKDDDEWRATV